MKHLVFAALCLVGANSTAQNWALLNPDYKYNYSVGGTDTITDQIFVTDVDTLGPDSFRYELNKVGTIHDCDTCGIAHWYLAVEQPQWLGDRCTRSPDGVWTFHKNGEDRMIHPLEGIGGSWLFDTINAITATVASITEGEVLGETDSLKVIQLTTGDSLLISRDHGLCTFPVPGTERPRVLVGLEGAQLGALLPLLNEVFGLSVGDVVQYRRLSYYFDMGPGESYSERRDKYVITEREEFTDSIRLTYTSMGIYQANQFGQGLTTSYNFDSGSWTVPEDLFPFGEVAWAYPQQVVRAMPWPVPVDLDTNHLTMVRHVIVPAQGSPSLMTNSFADIERPLGPSAYAQADYTASGWVEYRGPFGLYRYSRRVVPNWSSMSWYQYTFELEGAVVGGDTTGTLLPDEFFTVGIADGAEMTSSGLTCSLFNGMLRVNASEPMIEVNVLDASGRMLVRSTPLSQQVDLNIGALSSGVYVVNVRVRSGWINRRSMIMDQ